MMMMMNKAVFVAIALYVSVALVGCGSGGSNTTTAAVTTASPSASTTSSSACNPTKMKPTMDSFHATGRLDQPGGNNNGTFEMWHANASTRIKSMYALVGQDSEIIELDNSSGSTMTAFSNMQNMCEVMFSPVLCFEYSVKSCPETGDDCDVWTSNVSENVAKGTPSQSVITEWYFQKDSNMPIAIITTQTVGDQQYPGRQIFDNVTVADIPAKQFEVPKSWQPCKSLEAEQMLSI